MIPRLPIWLRLFAVGMGSAMLPTVIVNLPSLGFAGYFQIVVSVFLIVAGVITGPLGD